MKLFNYKSKTRREVEHLQYTVDELREMLRAHFDIKYTLEDFAKYYDKQKKRGINLKDADIPVSVGEFLHFYDMLSPTIDLSMSFRGLDVVPKDRVDV